MKDTIRFILLYILALIIYNLLMFIVGREIDLYDAFILPLIITIILFLVFKTKEDKENQ
ncbi:hypothetical protein [Staphylococcus simulans]|uniref:hypothetical protein n=1 Tax=Staphylococcus simulans TaxID=1286 RepID=UPI00399ADB26